MQTQLPDTPQVLLLKSQLAQFRLDLDLSLLLLLQNGPLICHFVIQPLQLPQQSHLFSKKQPLLGLSLHIVTCFLTIILAVKACLGGSVSLW